MRNIILILLFLLPVQSFAAITFTGGKWETTFDCIEQDQTTIDWPVSCDELEVSGIYTFDGQVTSITTPANNPDGLGGRGYRTFIGDGVNVGTGNVKVGFQTAQKELWVRWYMRHEEGFTWASINYDKHLYFYTDMSDGGGTQVIPEFYGFDYYNVVVQSIVSSGYYNQLLSDVDNGWDAINSAGGDDGNGHKTSDGEFHCYELHMKMDTDKTDGIAQLWIDGKLVLNSGIANFSDGKNDALLGWTYFTFENNQRTPNNGTGGAYVDYDDMVIYNQTPPNQDAFGNPYIGPIATQETSGVTTISNTGTAQTISNTGTVWTIGN